jgi:hypothetical protein
MRAVILVRMKRIALLLILAMAVALAAASTANAEKYLYWYQRNMAAGQASRGIGPHNHNYNEMYFGPNAGWFAKLWELTPAGAVHFVRNCNGNCFYAHPATYYARTWCSNQDPNGSTHFVSDCMEQW